MKQKDISRFLDDEDRVKQWPTKHSDKELVLTYLASKFELDRIYHESEVNTLLKRWHTFKDWPLLRRELFEYGYMDRNAAGTSYKLNKRV